MKKKTAQKGGLFFYHKAGGFSKEDARF